MLITLKTLQQKTFTIEIDQDEKVSEMWHMFDEAAYFFRDCDSAKLEGFHPKSHIRPGLL